VAQKSLNKWVYVSLLLLLTAVIPAAYGPGLAYAGSLTPTRRGCPAYTQHEKAILVDIDVMKLGRPAPSFSDLKAANFTLVGTYPRVGDSSEWNIISTWIKSAKAAGLRTLVQTYPQATVESTVNVGIDYVNKAASIGADVIEIDELLGVFPSITKSQFLSIVQAGLSVNPHLQFIATEWTQGAMDTLLSWTTGYECVRVANDNYMNKGMVDVDIQLSAAYGRVPLTWLIFSASELDYDCYLHLNDWITYVKQRNMDALFFQIDRPTSWQTQWPKVATF
jgi:hypothetical protein